MSKKFIHFSEKDANGVSIITTRNVLREKVGFGGLDPSAIEQAEKFIRENDVDYLGYALDLATQAKAAIKAEHANISRDKKVTQAIIRPVMQLKSSGSMFQYHLISEISGIVLDFLEGHETLTDDALNLLDVYVKLLDAVTAGKITGDGGAMGKVLVKELNDACTRYTKKYASPEN